MKVAPASHAGRPVREPCSFRLQTAWKGGGIPGCRHVTRVRQFRHRIRSAQLILAMNGDIVDIVWVTIEIEIMKVQYCKPQVLPHDHLGPSVSHHILIGSSE